MLKTIVSILVGATTYFVLSAKWNDFKAEDVRPEIVAQYEAIPECLSTYQASACNRKIRRISEISDFEITALSKVSVQGSGPREYHEDDFFLFIAFAASGATAFLFSLFSPIPNTREDYRATSSPLEGILTPDE